MGKCVFCNMRTTKVQTSLRIHSLISAFIVHCLYSIIPILANIQSFKTLTSLCRWAGRFESYLVASPRRHVLLCCGSFMHSCKMLYFLFQNLFLMEAGDAMFVFYTEIFDKVRDFIVKIWKIGKPQKSFCNYPKISIMWFNYAVKHPKDA